MQPERIKIAVKLVVGGVLFLLGKWLADSIVDERIEGIAYSTLRNLNSPDLPAESYPVRIVDISSVSDFKSSSSPTPASVLQDLVEEVAALKPPPRAIGIDIDFAARAPGEDGNVRTDVPIATVYSEHLVFLRYAANEAEMPGPKLYVGVGRIADDLSRTFIPDHTDPEMARLAGRLSKLAALVVTEEDPATMPRYYQVSRSKEPLFSMGHQLAYAIDPVTNQSLSPWQSFLSWLSPPETKELPWRQQTIAVDYRIAEHLDSISFPATVRTEGGTLRATLGGAKQVLQESLVSHHASGDSPGYAVLIGYAGKAGGDSMVLQRSGRAHIPITAAIYPRIVQHAAYVDTFLQRPFVKVSHVVGVGLEIVLSLAFFLIGYFHESVASQLGHGEAKRSLRLWLIYGMYLIGLTILWLGVFAGFGIAPFQWLPIAGAAAVGALFVRQLVSGMRTDADYARKTHTVRNALVRLAMAGLVVAFTWGLARIGVFWTGSLVVVLFVILEGYLEPVLEYVGLSVVNRFRSAPVEAH